MLGYLSTPAELGLFAAASRFGSVARLAPQAVFAGALPVLSHEHGRDRASAERVSEAFDRILLGASAAVAVGCALFAAPLLRLIYGKSFIGAAPALLWVGVGLIPLLSNSGRKVFLYASCGESVVVRWSDRLLLQGCAGASIPAFGSAGPPSVSPWARRSSADASPRRPTAQTRNAEHAEHAEILSM